MNNQPPSTADRIKAAALPLFLESGYAGTSLSDIAKAVGIKTPSIYAHFDSKDQLFIRLFDDVIAEDLETFRRKQEALQSATPVDRLRQAFDFYADHDEQSMGQSFLRQTFIMPPRHLREQLRISFLQYEDQISSIVLDFYGRGIEEGYFIPGSGEQMIALLYAGSDGLLVEHQVYDEELLSSRKEKVWEALLQLVATARGKGQDE